MKNGSALEEGEVKIEVFFSYWKRLRQRLRLSKY
uniref:Uncharacterized protein n=1 Tax=Candidatus Kentrum sp. TC TaxID=2126339 RepID=A0A450Z5K2_9GAMM|nr:MAG: hypothetical protein BECKTC1821D_GA0114238_106712 [Candidatus Kentron sp. TC]